MREPTLDFKQLKLLVMDVDGVLSDGQIYFANSGEEIKAFNTQDGLGIKLLQKQGIESAIITGRQSEIVANRAENLGIDHVIQGCDTKLQALNTLKSSLGLEYHEIAYIGDDLPDLPAIRAVGLGMTVNNANPHIKDHATWCSTHAGGHGAVREACDFILEQRGVLQSVVEAYY